MYVKWIGYDNLFNSWIDKKDFLLKRVNTFLKGTNFMKEILM